MNTQQSESRNMGRHTMEKGWEIVWTGARFGMGMV